jgi:acyl carrier protein
LLSPTATALQPKRVLSMKPIKEELIDILYQSLEEVNEQLPNEKQIPKSLDAILIGGSGALDSLAFVNFVASVEEKCAEKYGISLSLTDISAQQDDCFEDVGKFADFLFQHLSQRLH